MDTWITDEGAPGTVIETSRLRLRALHLDDLDALHVMFADPRVMAMFGLPPLDRLEVEFWLDRALRHWERHGFGLLAIIDKVDGAMIGDCGLELKTIDGRAEAELGYDLRSDYWGRGLATEAAGAVRDHAFEVLERPRLVSLIRIGNVASRRVAEKVGMRHERDLLEDDTPYALYSLSAPVAP